MKASTDVAEAIETMREILQKMVISLDSLSERVDGMAAEIERIKDAQNELLGGLALYERVKKFKEDYLGLELKPSTAQEIDWDNMKAYCNNCTKMVNIVEPTSTLKDEHIIVRAKCQTCGTSVLRNLS
jgi:phage-related minor tail protein